MKTLQIDKAFENYTMTPQKLAYTIPYVGLKFHPLQLDPNSKSRYEFPAA